MEVRVRFRGAVWRGRILGIRDCEGGLVVRVARGVGGENGGSGNARAFCACCGLGLCQGTWAVIWI